MTTTPTVVLAFSGGLDTSFCVPYLIEKGYRVHTIYVGSGGDDDDDAIEARALELGASQHTSHDASEEIWEGFVVPFVMGGQKYQGRYPLLCSDRYAIAAAMVGLAKQIDADAVAHGCTAMGNDQFRFDQSIRSLSTLPILAPIREIQSVTTEPRAYEIEYLETRGFAVAHDAKRYTINQNVLGATISGSEIDRWEAPGEETYRLTTAPNRRSNQPVDIEIGFEQGVPVSIDGEPITDGAATLSKLNTRLGACGVGRGIYTGDTIVGLKGRIVFEAPGLEGLLTAHKALEELTLTRTQSRVKRQIAEEWSGMVFGGLFFDPARTDLESLIRSSQRNVTGTVTVRAQGGSCDAVAVSAANPLTDKSAVYAQHAPWNAADAEGFIRIAGLGSALGATKLAAVSMAEAGA